MAEAPAVAPGASGQTTSRTGREISVQTTLCDMLSLLTLLQFTPSPDIWKAFVFYDLKFTDNPREE